MGRLGEGHHRLFCRLLHEAGQLNMEPGPRFRFGLMQFVDLTENSQVAEIEQVVDAVSADLYVDDLSKALERIEGIPECARLLEHLCSIKCTLAIWNHRFFLQRIMPNVDHISSLDDCYWAFRTNCLRLPWRHGEE